MSAVDIGQVTPQSALVTMSLVLVLHPDCASCQSARSPYVSEIKLSCWEPVYLQKHSRQYPKALKLTIEANPVSDRQNQVFVGRHVRL